MLYNLIIFEICLHTKSLFIQELGEEIPKILTSDNKNIPKNLVIYSFKDGGYIPLPPPENIITLFEFEGTALHIDSAEAKEQISRGGQTDALAPVGTAEVEQQRTSENTPEPGDKDESEAGEGIFIDKEF